MAQVTKANTFLTGTTILSAEVNENFDDIYNQFNGLISNSNISDSAAIVDTKFATISTAGKVSGAALTLLTSTPSAAGLIPSGNQDTVTTLVDGANIATDASASTTFEVTLGGNRTLDNPTNAVTASRRVWIFRQDGTGSRTITLGSEFRVSNDINSGSIVLSTAASAIDYMGAIRNGTDSKWDVIAFAKAVA